MSGWEQRIVTGNPQADQATVEQHRQAAAAQGLAFDAQPLPTGGFHVRAYLDSAAGLRAAGATGLPQLGSRATARRKQQQAYGPPLGGYGQAPQQQQQHWGGGAPA